MSENLELFAQVSGKTSVASECSELAVHASGGVPLKNLAFFLIIFCNGYTLCTSKESKPSIQPTMLPIQTSPVETHDFAAARAFFARSSCDGQNASADDSSVTLLVCSRGQSRSRFVVHHLFPSASRRSLHRGVGSLAIASRGIAVSIARESQSRHWFERPHELVRAGVLTEYRTSRRPRGGSNPAKQVRGKAPS